MTCMYHYKVDVGYHQIRLAYVARMLSDGRSGCSLGFRRALPLGHLRLCLPLHSRAYVYFFPFFFLPNFDGS